MKKISCIVLLIISILFIFIQNVSVAISHTESPTNRYVFITLDASKYHLSGCDYLEGRPVKVSLEWAQVNGYGACKYCEPYVVKTSKNSLWNTNVFLAMCIIVSAILIVLLVIKNHSKHSYIDKYNINKRRIKL